MCDPFGTRAAAEKAAKEAKNAEERIRAEEAARRYRITEGNQKIDSAFAQYDPAYYSAFEETYKNNFNPQVDQQYSEARDKLIAALAGRGTLGGTVGTNALAKAAKTRDDSRIQVGSEAKTAATDLKGRVENQKSNLYALNQSAADPEGILTRATGAATALAAPPQFSQLGQLFSTALAPYATYRESLANSAGPAYRYPGQSAGASRGSGSVVRG
jgi:hypothetical protein